MRFILDAPGNCLQVVYAIGYFIAFWIAVLRSQTSDLNEFVMPYPSATEESYFAFSNKVGLSLIKLLYRCGLCISDVHQWPDYSFYCLLLNSLTFMYVFSRFNKVLGGVLNFIVVYIGIFLVLYVWP